MARAAQGQSNNLINTASTDAAQYGATSAAQGNTLNSFLQQELRNPTGYTQGQQTSMLSAGQAGTGGANSSLAGQANLQAARTRNGGGFSTALDAAARSKNQANAGMSEGIAADNANLQQKQQQAAATGLQGLYGTNVDAMHQALGVQSQGIQDENQSSQNGWLQNATGVLKAVRG